MSRKFLYSILVGIFTLLSLNSPAQEVKDTLRVLFVGNSYTYYENLPQYSAEDIGSSALAAGSLKLQFYMHPCQEGGQTGHQKRPDNRTDDGYQRF